MKERRIMTTPRPADNALAVTPDDASPVPKVHFHVNSLHQALLLQEKGELPNPVGADTVITISPPATPPDTRLPPERRKTALALVFLFLNMVANVTVLSFIHDRVPDRDTNPPLPDILFSLFPVFEKGLYVSEVLLVVLTWLTVIILVFHKHRFILFRRLFLIMGLLYFWRSMTMFVTQVPVASRTYYCSPKANSTNVVTIVKRVFTLMTGMGLSINGKHVFCGDYIYSGHTVIFVMAYLTVKEYAPLWCRIFNIFIALLSFIGVFLIIISRGHYTVDVVIAYFVTTRVFWTYHTMANTPSLKLRNMNNYLANEWWFRIFLYFEKNVLDTVPNEYYWPIHWRKHFKRFRQFTRYRVTGANVQTA